MTVIVLVGFAPGQSRMRDRTSKKLSSLLPQMRAHDDLLDDLRDAAFSAGKALTTSALEDALRTSGYDLEQAKRSLGIPAATPPLPKPVPVENPGAAPPERAAKDNLDELDQKLADLRAQLAQGLHPSQQGTGAQAPPTQHASSPPFVIELVIAFVCIAYVIAFVIA